MPYHQEKVKELRMLLSLTQHALAARLGVPQSTIYRWEAGSARPNVEHLSGMIDLLREEQVNQDANFFFPAED